MAGFGDFLCGNLPSVGGPNLFINTKFSKPNTPISKSSGKCVPHMLQCAHIFPRSFTALPPPPRPLFHPFRY